MALRRPMEWHNLVLPREESSYRIPSVFDRNGLFAYRIRARWRKEDRFDANPDTSSRVQEPELP